jgi:hypothetical protein
MREFGGTFMDNETISNKEKDFNEVIAIIENARESAFRAVNRELINMYLFLELRVYCICYDFVEVAQ